MVTFVLLFPIAIDSSVVRFVVFLTLVALAV